MTNVTKLRIRSERRYNCPEDIVRHLSDKIMGSRRTYASIARETGLSSSTIGRAARRQGLSPKTMFMLADWGGLDLIGRERYGRPE